MRGNPRLSKILRSLVRRKLLPNNRPVFKPHPLSQECLDRIEREEMPRRDVVMLLLARERENQRNDAKEARRLQR